MNLLEKDSLPEMAISQLPNVLERFIKAQIKGLDIRYLYMIIGDFYCTLGLYKFK